MAERKAEEVGNPGRTAALLQGPVGTLPEEGASAAAESRGLGRASQVVEAGGAAARQLERECRVSTVGIAQIKVRAGGFEENFRKITEYIDSARNRGVELLVFPELTIPGYLALDNFDDELFVQANKEVLERVVLHTSGSRMTTIVGFVDSKFDPETLRMRHYNAAAVIRDGCILAVVDKTLLPDYDIFWETRYFASAHQRNVVSNSGYELGVEICEDLWDKDYSIKVTDELRAKGAEIIANLSCSPFHPGKYAVRDDLVRQAAAGHQVPFLYANMVGTQDGYEGEVVFDGRSMIFSPDGKLLAIGKAFDEELIIADLHHAREIPLPDWNPAEEVHDALVLGIQEYFDRNGFTRAYIGLSGGIDSAVTAALLVEALGSENVIGVTMPSHITSEETKSDALQLAENLGIRCDTRPIGEMFAAWERDAVETHGSLESLTKQNIQARFRGNILMEYTNQDRKGLVVSTGNKTEMALGYCTLYGDMSGGLAAIGDVSKLMVYEIAELINQRAGRELIPVTTIQRVPTAELEPGQTDEANLPADYDVLSPLVEDLVEQRRSWRELLEIYPGEVVRKTARLIRVNEFKRRQAAPIIRVSSKSFGAGRRFPIDTRFDPFFFTT